MPAGFNFDYEKKRFVAALGQNGAAAGSIFEANGGTAPIGTTNNRLEYTPLRSGLVFWNMYCSGGDLNGATAVELHMPLPMPPVSDVTDQQIGTGLARRAAGTAAILIAADIPNAQTYATFYRADNGTRINNDDLDENNDTIRASGLYKVLNF